jgi:ketosteroid isomerase-like protein
MSQADVELYRDVVEAWNRDDLDAMLETMAPDYEFQTAQLFSDTEPIYRGRDGFREFWNTFRSAWEEIALDVERIEDLGDGRVLGLLTFHGRGRTSGVEVSVRYGHLATLRDGRFVHLRGFGDWEEALKAAGLRE